MEVAEKHQLKIARQTLQMSDAMAGVMGGMDKPTALRIVEAHDEAQRAKRNRAARDRHDARTSMGLKRTPYGYE